MVPGVLGVTRRWVPTPQDCSHSGGSLSAGRSFPGGLCEAGDPEPSWGSSKDSVGLGALPSTTSSPSNHLAVCTHTSAGERGALWRTSGKAHTSPCTLAPPPLCAGAGQAERGASSLCTLHTHW